jgi:hypothetical protein
MYPPGQNISVRNNGIGLLLSQAALPLIIGVTAGSVADTLYIYTDPNELRDEQLGGPAVEMALPVMQAAGGCLLLKTQASVAASNSSVTAAPVASATGTVTVAGTPRDAYRVVIRIRLTGALGVAKFDYSLDNGRTRSETLTVPAGGTYAIPHTGLTLTFVPGAGPVIFEVGDQHTFESTPAVYNTANLAAAITALLDQIGSRKIRQVYLAGKHATAVAAATMAAALATHMATLESLGYFARAMLDAGDDTVSNVRTEFASFADDRVAVVFGDADAVSLGSFAGWGVPTVPAVDLVAERAAGAVLSENLGRKASGALTRVRAISHDEDKSTQFSESEKITTLRTFRGEAGFFITTGFLKSPAGSDFLYWEWGRVIDEFCETVKEGQDKWILANLRTRADGTGRLSPLDATRIEEAVRPALKARLLDPTNAEGLPGHVSALRYTVDRANNYLSTRTFRSKGAAVPLVPAQGVETEIGFERSV